MANLGAVAPEVHEAQDDNLEYSLTLAVLDGLCFSSSMARVLEMDREAQMVSNDAILENS